MLEIHPDSMHHRRSQPPPRRNSTLCPRWEGSSQGATGAEVARVLADYAADNRPRIAGGSTA